MYMFVGVQGRLTRPQPIDYGVTQGLCTALCSRYACLRPMVVGHSRLRREIPAVVLGENAPTQVLMVAAFGAREWFSTLCALRLCEEMCSHLRAELPLCEVPLSRALQGRQIWLVPLCNPDGVEIARYGSVAAGTYAAAAARMGADTPGVWRGNACGVDISSNSTAVWDELQAFGQKNEENSQTEPEVAALAALCRRVPFRHAIVLGCGGETVGWYDGDLTPSRNRLMAQVLAAVSDYALAPCADGFSAWFVNAFRRPALALRLGQGNLPLPLRDFESIYQKAREMLLLSLLF